MLKGFIDGYMDAQNGRPFDDGNEEIEEQNIYYCMNFFIKNRKRRHIAYVEKRVVELRKQIADQAVQFGYIDQMARTQFLKYNEYLKKILK